MQPVDGVSCRATLMPPLLSTDRRPVSHSNLSAKSVASEWRPSAAPAQECARFLCDAKLVARKLAHNTIDLLQFPFWLPPAPEDRFCARALRPHLSRWGAQPGAPRAGSRKRTSQRDDQRQPLLSMRPLRILRGRAATQARVVRRRSHANEMAR